jgi:hypothetical protein
MFNELAQNFQTLTQQEQEIVFQLSTQHAKTLLKLLPGHPLLVHALYKNGDASDPAIAAYNQWQSKKLGA